MGSSIGGYLTGQGRLGQPATPQSPRFVEGTGLAMNTDPAQRLRPLRDARRAGAAGAGRGAGHRAGRSVRRDRDRQGREDVDGEDRARLRCGQQHVPSPAARGARGNAAVRTRSVHPDAAVLCLRFLAGAGRHGTGGRRLPAAPGDGVRIAIPGVGGIPRLCGRDGDPRSHRPAALRGADCLLQHDERFLGRGRGRPVHQLLHPQRARQCDQPPGHLVRGARALHRGIRMQRRYLLPNSDRSPCANL